MFLSRKYIEALETLKQENSELREDLAAYRVKSDEELKTLKKTLKDLIIYVEEKDATQEKIQDETEPAASETEIEFIRKLATDILEWTNSRTGGMPTEKACEEHVFSGEIPEKYLKRPPWADEIMEGFEKIGKRMEALENLPDSPKKPLWADEIMEKINALEKASGDLKKQFIKINDHIENAKKDINSKISYAVARLKT